jgi:hypothetical protein
MGFCSVHAEVQNPGFQRHFMQLDKLLYGLLLGPCIVSTDATHTQTWYTTSLALDGILLSHAQIPGYGMYNSVRHVAILILSFSNITPLLSKLMRDG